MKKSAVFAGAIVLAAVAYTGVSWYVGVRAEDTLRAAVDRANERLARTLGSDAGSLSATVAITEYRRGVFSSDVRYSVVIQEADGRTELGMDDHMQHGPFPWALVKQGQLAPQLAYSRSQLVDTEAVKRWFDAARNAMPLAVDTRIGFSGQGESVWRFAPLEWTSDGEQLSFSGGQMQVRFSNDFRDSESEGHFASFTAGEGGDPAAFAVKDIRLTSTSATGSDGGVEVHSNLQAASLVVAGSEDDRVTIEQPQVVLDSRQSDSLLDAALRYDFKRVLIGDIDLGTISLGGSVAKLDFEAVSAIMVEYDAIAREHGAEDGEEFELTEADEARLLGKLGPALASSPELALDPVIWRNDKGESSLALKAAFQPLPGAVGGAEGAAGAGGAEAAGHDETPAAEYTRALRELRLELALSRPMVLQAFAQTGGSDAEQQQLQMLAALMFDRYVSQLEADGLVRRDGDRALATIVYADGAVDVNGQRMTVEEFLERFGSFLM